jgi:hypothetical protein
VFTATLLLALSAPAQPPQDMLAARVDALERRVAALESRAAPVAAPAFQPAVWYGAPQSYPFPAGLSYAAPVFYGDGGSVCGPGGCGPAAGGARWQPFGGRFRR